MKKKLAVGLIVLLSAGMLSACGQDATTVDYNGYSYDDLEQQAFNDLYIVESLYEVAQSGEDISGYADMYSDVTEEMVEAAGTWGSVEEECGEYMSYDETTFTVTKSGKTLTTDVTVQFSERTATFEVVYSYNTMEMTGISITTDYTLGETMEKAALNTVISMSIVFLVLILISLIIYAFNIIPYLDKKKKARAAANKPAAAAVPAASAPVQAKREEDLTDDTELAAVIAAAIAASEGTTTDGFVVRSINRR